jgi:hypothetical protein
MYYQDTRLWRKEPAFYPNPADQKSSLKLSPTSPCKERYSRSEDYELKERITLEFSGGGDDYH